MLNLVYTTKLLFATPNLCYIKKTWRLIMDINTIINDLLIQEREITKLEKSLSGKDLEHLHTKIQIEISQVLKSIK